MPKKPQTPPHERVKAWGEKNGLSYRQMAELAGIPSANTIHRIVTGKQAITATMAKRLAGAMGCGWSNLVAERVVF